MKFKVEIEIPDFILENYLEDYNNCNAKEEKYIEEFFKKYPGELYFLFYEFSEDVNDYIEFLSVEKLNEEEISGS